MALNISNASLEITAGLSSQFPKKLLPQIVLTGRSNVGKSSLINMILGRKSLARVSTKPGKTVTVNFYNIDNKMYLVDLPGYGFARSSLESKKKWSDLTESYLLNNKSIKYAFCLVDLKVGATEDDLLIIDYFKRNSILYSIIATKSDKLNSTERNDCSFYLKNQDLGNYDKLIITSAKSKEGRDDIYDFMDELLAEANQ